MTRKVYWQWQEAKNYLPEGQKRIIASQYKLYLPTEQQLLEEVKKEIKKRGL